jgi:hypothetical protein
MNRIAGFALLVTLSVSWSLQAKAQSDGVAEYARQSAQLDKKAAKEYRKSLKKSAKTQRKLLKKAKRQNGNRTSSTVHLRG